MARVHVLTRHVCECSIALVLSREPVELFPARIDQPPKNVTGRQAYTDAVRLVDVRGVAKVMRVTDLHREVAVVVGRQALFVEQG